MALKSVSEARHALNAQAGSYPRNRVISLLLLLVVLVVSVTSSMTGAQSSYNALPVNVESPQASELLKNRGFENPGSTTKDAAQWTRINADNDWRVCNKAPNPPIAETGKCAFRFDGKAGRTTTLTQTIQPGVIKKDDTVYLGGFVKANQLTLANGDAQLRLIAHYQNGEKDSVMLPISAGTYDYIGVDAPALLLTHKVKKLQVQVRLIGGSGRLFVDTLSLWHVPAPVNTSTPTNTPTVTDTYTPTNTSTPTDTPTPTSTPKSF